MMTSAKQLEPHRMGHPAKLKSSCQCRSWARLRQSAQRRGALCCPGLWLCAHMQAARLLQYTPAIVLSCVRTCRSMLCALQLARCIAHVPTDRDAGKLHGGSTKAQGEGMGRHGTGLVCHLQLNAKAPAGSMIQWHVKLLAFVTPRCLCGQKRVGTQPTRVFTYATLGCTACHSNGCMVP
jgi:hypothetical protein